MPLNREPGCRAVIGEQLLVSCLDHRVAVVGGVRLRVRRKTRARSGVGIAMRTGHQIAARIGVLEYGDSLALGSAVRDGMHGLMAQLAGGAVVDDERPEAVVHVT